MLVLVVPESVVKREKTIMVKHSATPSFMDMFAKFGHDLKLSNVDVEAILDHHRKNLEALEKSARATASGASTLMARQREMLGETLREVTEMAQSYSTPGSPRELVARQTEFARKAFESAVGNAGEVAELVRKSGTESLDILRDRIKEAMVEVRDGFEKKNKS
jgi:phasin family protein